MTSASATAASPAIRTDPRPDIDEQIRKAETLSEILRLRGRGEPGRSHIQIYEEDDQLRTITFGELYERASVVAADLRRRGLEPGQTVAIMLPTCAEFFWTFAGILLAGGIPVPIYPPFRADRIAEYAARQSNILRNAEAQFLVTWRQAENLAKLLQPRVPSLREVLNAQKLASAPWRIRKRPGGRVAAGATFVASRARRRHRVPAIHFGLDGRSQRRGADAREPAGEYPLDYFRAGYAGRTTLAFPGCRCITTWD